MPPHSAPVPADSDPPPPPVAEGADADKAPGCRAMLQKETPGGLKDEECGKEVLDNHAGLCMWVMRMYIILMYSVRMATDKQS